MNDFRSNHSRRNEFKRNDSKKDDSKKHGFKKHDSKFDSSDPFPDPEFGLTPSKPTILKKHKPLVAKLTDSIHWYWETLAATPLQKKWAHTWFTKSSSAQFLRSVAVFRHFPVSDVPEIAFVGRSNVGKSSLLNALVNADVKSGLARTSKTPGCTTTLNLYGVGPYDGVRIRKGVSGGYDRIVGVGGMLIVDLPGYGEGSLQEWGPEIMKYLVNRKQLRRVFVLLDASVGLKETDRSLLASLRLNGVSHQVILSKLDKLFVPEGKEVIRHDMRVKRKAKPVGSTGKLAKMMEEIAAEVKPPQGAGALGELLSVSSEVSIDGKYMGLDAVRVSMLEAAGVKYIHKKR
ncbi:hypothetical protein M011DRAFT_408063 [Sporormia fimetaria CBS 119925]|uniref:EngB-type G domain-containing protein n=1 Tax=Sporormia fimetaria CBS 119925 TaxID=1340428 RepID=A0A6A6V564_9PLEO|nr:hypothetical protein M011DRAFT_408063 [Sporormia fimetaria CBS 119925]